MYSITMVFCLILSGNNLKSILAEASYGSLEDARAGGLKSEDLDKYLADTEDRDTSLQDRSNRNIDPYNEEEFGKRRFYDTEDDNMDQRMKFDNMGLDLDELRALSKLVKRGKLDALKMPPREGNAMYRRMRAESDDYPVKARSIDKGVPYEYKVGEYTFLGNPVSQKKKMSRRKRVNRNIDNSVIIKSFIIITNVLL
ncbi:unnamed protein product [Gordionus sp. m RMFG-2023]